MFSFKKNRMSARSIVINLFFILLSLSFIIPMMSIFSISLSSDKDIVEHGYALIPKHFDLSAYNFLFQNPRLLLLAYKVTIIVSGAGLVLYLFMGSMCAYALSRTDFKYKSAITFYLFFTMLFSGGLVPQYILMTKYLHLQNTYMALILPTLGNVWYVFLMRTFFQQIPSSIVESATIDGASEFRIYVQMIIPLSKPVLATVGVFTLLAYWNSWFQALLYIDKPDLYPLQYMLQIMLRNMQEIMDNLGNNSIGASQINQIPTEPVRMAMCILAAGPMLFVFPFFQKYFVKGLTVGSVKG